jgi:hypothetical protein
VLPALCALQQNYHAVVRHSIQATASNLILVIAFFVCPNSLVRLCRVFWCNDKFKDGRGINSIDLLEMLAKRALV